MYGLTKSYKRKHTPLAQNKHNIFTQGRVTYAQITKQNSYDPTNIEQGPYISYTYQQTSDIHDFKNMMKTLFQQRGNKLKLLKNWDDFRRLINERLTSNVSLKIEEVEAAVKFFNDTIQWAG
jgi:hypothetical protein